MKHLLVLQDSKVQDAAVLTSLLKRMNKTHKIHLLCDNSLLNLFRYCNGVFTESIEMGTKCSYDLAINFSPMDYYTKLFEGINAKEKLGFGSENNYLKFYNSGADTYYRSRYIGIKTKSNIFQLFYGLANQTWEGEGYWINYYPKNKTRKKSIGIAVKDSILKGYIYKNLKIYNNRLWNIPFKQNVLKQMDEINRCKNVITDDLSIVHLSLALRKKVEILSKLDLPYKIETFGAGNLHLIDKELYA